MKTDILFINPIKKLNWVAVLAILYLAIPLEIFILTHFVVWLSIPLTLFEGLIFLRVMKSLCYTHEGSDFTKREWIFGALILGSWVLLSGIGGYMFQNYDHHIRNAVFRDLINYEWPVIYKQNNSGVVTSYGLVYYTGFWLPSALIGKWLGWKAANFSLFIWTFIGVFLSTVLIKKYLKSSLIFSAILIVFFSGMDFLAVVLTKAAGLDFYPPLWPPIAHLEWWAGGFQYSSFTTQLFWVFNQALPCWIAILVIFSFKNPKNIFFIWGLSFFFSPIPAIGLLPYVLLTIANRTIDSSSGQNNLSHKGIESFIRYIIKNFRLIFTAENIIGGGSIIAISAIYFSANSSVTKISLISMDPLRIILLIIFFLMEFLILWWLLKQDHKIDPYWYTCGFLLAIIPFFTIANGLNFMLRASIPSLFLLMLWSGEALLKIPRVKYRPALILVLIIGAFTPLYEINRSIYRTVVFYSNTKRGSSLEETPINKDPVPFSQPYEIAENAHPNTLAADAIRSLTYYDLDTYWELIGKTEGSFFFDHLSRNVTSK